MSDLKAPVPVQTRRANEGVQPRGHRQTTLSEEAQRDLKLKRDSARIQRTRALLKAAQDRLLAHLAILDEALIGSGPCGSFTFYEEVAIDFAMRMDLYLTAEQMAREPSAVNRAAVQAFAKCVKAGGLASLHAARSTKEAAITDFVALRHRLRHGENSAQAQELV